MTARLTAAGPVWAPAAALLGLLVWSAASLAWTIDDGRTTDELLRTGGYLALLASVALLVDHRNWRRAAALVAIAGVAVCALAVAGRLWPQLLSLSPRNSPERLGFPLGYWNALGCWSAMTLTMCLAWAAHAVRPLHATLALAAVPLCALAIYFTLSRAAIGGALLGALIVLSLGRNRVRLAGMAAIAAAACAGTVAVARSHSSLVLGLDTSGAAEVAVVLVLACAACASGAWGLAEYRPAPRRRDHRKTRRRLLAAAALLALLTAAVVLPPVAREAWDQFQVERAVPAAGQNPDQRLTNLSGSRITAWREAWAAVEAEPLTGVGAGGFGPWWDDRGENPERLTDAHNIYLEAWAELGIVGFALMLAFCAAIAYAAVVARRSLSGGDELGVHAGLCGALAVFALQAGVDKLWESPAPAALAVSAAAIAGSAGR